MADKQRIEIPFEVAAGVLFESDRTCCVCRERRRPVQIHHVDDDPSNNERDNLVVLCFDCHRDTQIRGGFDRKLDAAQIRLYRDDWVARVRAARGDGPAAGVGGDPVLDPAQTSLVLRYMQVRDRSEDLAYSIEADYPQVGAGSREADAETNLCISSFIARMTAQFRAGAVASAPEKARMRASGFAAAARDDMSISHRVWLLTPYLLSVELAVWRYGAGAAHPNRATHTLNFRRRQSWQLEAQDIFRPSAPYARLLSDYCVAQLLRQQASRVNGGLDSLREEWVRRGAGPNASNFDRYVLERGGLRFFFDEYRVGPYSDGRYEVPVPVEVAEPVLRDWVIPLLG